jgi:sugar lactone lactonase YvrE
MSRGKWWLLLLVLLACPALAHAQASQMYWTNETKISRANPDGTAVQNLITIGLSDPLSLAIDQAGGKMYWTDGSHISRANLDGSNAEQLVSAGAPFAPVGIALDTAVGKMYWTDDESGIGSSKIQRANLDGTNIENLVVLGINGKPDAIALDVGGGKMYWTDTLSAKIQRANLDGSNLQLFLTSGLLQPHGIAVDSAGGKVYWTDTVTHKIQRANLDGSQVEDLLTSASGLDCPVNVALDVPGGKMYWTDPLCSCANCSGKIRRADLSGAGPQDLVTTGLSDPEGIALTISVVPPPPPTTLVAAVLPASRSVQIGVRVATVFATVINTGANPALQVGIALQNPAATPSTFSYQTTDPLTNVPVGTPNTPANIATGGSQTYVIAIDPTAAFGPTDVAFTFAGTNTPAVPVLVGINTLLLSASFSPVPDIVALAATVGNTGIVNIPGATGTGAFAVATSNVGASDLITVTADTGSAAVPVAINLCQTDSTAACISPLGPTVTTQINSGDHPTFTVLVTGSAVIPLDPAVNRVFVRFKDSGGVVRGATSVAVQTQ